MIAEIEARKLPIMLKEFPPLVGPKGTEHVLIDEVCIGSGTGIDTGISDHWAKRVRLEF
jgi:hypothetical protein